MNVAIIFIVIALVLFGLAYITKRRFGVLGLALAAGSMISGLWATQLTPLVRDAGLVIQSPPLITVISVVLVLLPAVLLLFSGPNYHGVSKRIIGAALFAVLAVALLIEPLGSAMILEGDGRTVYEFLANNRIYIITGGLILALLDVLSTRSTRGGKEKSSGKH